MEYSYSAPIGDVTMMLPSGVPLQTVLGVMSQIGTIGVAKIVKCSVIVESQPLAAVKIFT